MKYFTLNSDTFIWIKSNQVLLYGSHNGSHLLCDLSNGVRLLCEKLIDESNLYCVSFDDADENIVSFVNESVVRNLGTVSEENDCRIAIPPFLKVQHSLSRLNQDEENMYILRYLSCLTIFIGGECSQNNYCIQTDYPFPSGQTVSFDSITDFVLKNNRRTLSKVKFVFPVYDKDIITSILSSLKPVWNKLQIVLRFPEVLKSQEFFIDLSSKVDQLIVICEPDDDFEILERNYKYNLITRSERDYAKWNTVFEGEKLQYEIVPIYENNLAFFEKNVQITPDEVLASNQTKRIIHIHQSLNLFNWGKLYVYPDGSVYSKCGGEKIGNISESLNVMIGRELKNNYSWRHIRDFGKCQNCLLQFLCPSPAPFETESSDFVMLACKQRNSSPKG